MNTEPTFPPLLTGLPVIGQIDPFQNAISLAPLGCDEGTIVHNISNEYLRAAFIFAPEVSLEKACSMMVACGLGFSNALGSLAPPEVAVHLKWNGEILVNGAQCGELKISASQMDSDAIPNWLIVGITMPIYPTNDDGGGHTPNQTTLFEEGCAEVDPIKLLESWSRHTLVWINRWSDEGSAPLHAEWRSKAHGLGENIRTTLHGTDIDGIFLGIDENFGMLIRIGNDTKIKPLSSLLKNGVSA